MRYRCGQPLDNNSKVNATPVAELVQGNSPVARSGPYMGVLPTHDLTNPYSFASQAKALDNTFAPVLTGRIESLHGPR